jgi:hypothetical protein
MRYNKRNSDGETRSKTELRVIPGGGRFSLFIKGTKISSNWKERLTQQLLDGYLMEYLMEKKSVTKVRSTTYVGDYKKWH